MENNRGRRGEALKKGPPENGQPTQRAAKPDYAWGTGISTKALDTAGNRRGGMGS